MDRFHISRVELYAIADKNAPPICWTANQTPLLYTNNVIRIITSNGIEGIGATLSYTENGFDRCIIESMRTIAPGILGRNPLRTEELYNWLMERCTWGGLPAKSPFDIAAWDIKGKKAEMPIYELLGGARSKIQSYASSPMFDTVEEYETYIEDCIAEGFTAIKFHCSCIYERDMELVSAIQARFEGKCVRFMLDTASLYTPAEAMGMAKWLSENNWEWFEAPVPDSDCRTYQDLVNKFDLRILSDSNSLLTLHEITNALNLDTWTSVHLDATVCGGITPLNKCFAIAEGFGKTLEIQSMGFTLTQAANLHVALAHKNCNYFEQFFPYEGFELASKVSIRTDKEGYVHAPQGNGLGIAMDWEKVKDNCFCQYVFE
ncbi:mandelate racemase/muconate lactonizing enzyme family protein [Microbulbifer sp. ZKSA004]|uniref:mandelate racemase/muconate lactonizing enzyme family protein n=1 Tax=Microbulbifer sp. ZKSA004 TaxID=3243389 RepID=UPI00403A45CB